MPDSFCPADIAVEVSFGQIHDSTDLQACFKTGRSWSLYKEGEDYLFTFQKEDSGPVFMTARVNHDISRVELFCSNDFMDDEGRCFSPFQYPLDQIILMQYFVRHEGMIIHSAGLSLNQKGYIFPGFSGAGKSTLFRQFLEKGDAGLLSDDRIIIRKTDGSFRAFGTPWPGDADIAVNRSVPLDGIFFIHHADKNMIKDMGPAEAMRRLMPVASIPWHDKDAVGRMLAYCEGLVAHLPAYELHFRPDHEVVDFFGAFASEKAAH